jgi:NADH-quinone oxidoreductase subunit L
MRPGAQLAHTLVEVDDKGVDGAVTAIATWVGATSQRLRRVQTGFARSYALSMFAGALLLAAAIVIVSLR